MRLYRKFFYIWGGETFSALTSAVLQFAIIWWVTKETGSPLVLATASVAVYLFPALLSPFIGVWIDRWDKRRILIVSDLVIAFFSFVLGVLFYFDSVEIWHIYVILALRAIGNAFYQPTMMATIPLLAPKTLLMRVSAVSQGIQTLTEMAGPLLGALLLFSFDIATLALFDVAGALIASAAILRVDIPRTKASDVRMPDFFREFKLGVEAVRKHRSVALFICASALSMFILLPVNAMYPLVITQHFKGGAVEMGLTETFFGIGMVASNIVLGFWKRLSTYKERLICSAYLGLGLCLVFSSLMPSNRFVEFLAIFTLFGFFIPFESTSLTVLIQSKLEPDVLGRAFSLMNTLRIFSVISMLLIGAVADDIGLMNTFFISGIAILLIGFVSLFLMRRVI